MINSNISSHSVCHHAGFPLAPEKKKYAKFCGLKIESWQKITILVAKIALSIFIVPLFFKSYRSWIEKSRVEWIHSLKDSRPQNLKLAKQERKKQIEKCANWDFLTAESKKCKRDYNSIKGNVESVFPGPAFGKVYNTPNEYNLWMPGLAVGAHYLSNKAKVKGLIVCQTLKAFQKKFNEVLNHPEDQRCAFILPCISSKAGLLPDTAQHKVCVCFEKKGSEVHLAIMDSQPVELEFNPSHCQVNDDLWEDRDGFTGQELLFRPILKSSFEGLNAHFYISSVMRQKRGGCAVYSLRDGVEFLRDPDFFKKLTMTEEEVSITDELKIKFIKTLPPAFMVGSQSMKLLKDYEVNSPEKMDEKFPTKNKTLKTSLANTVIRVKEGEQNHYISWKMYKYNKIIINKLKNSSVKELQQIFKEFLVT